LLFLEAQKTGIFWSQLSHFAKICCLSLSIARCGNVDPFAGGRKVEIRVIEQAGTRSVEIAGSSSSTTGKLPNNEVVTLVEVSSSDVTSA
jgi:hypothetical protein